MIQVPGTDDLNDDDIDLVESDDPEENDVEIAGSESDDSETDTKPESIDFNIGTIQQGDLDATRIYLSEIGFSPLLNG